MKKKQRNTYKTLKGKIGIAARYFPLFSLQQHRRSAHDPEPRYYFSEVRKVKHQLKGDTFLKAIPIDFDVLAILVYEMLDYAGGSKRTNVNVVDIRPSLLTGASDLIKALDLFQESPLNIERIIIRGKTKKVVQDIRNPMPISVVRSRRDPRSKDFKIEGLELIMEIFRPIEARRSTFEQFVRRAEQYSGEEYKGLRKKDAKPYIRRIIAPALWRFLDQSLPGQSKTTKHWVGGHILNMLRLLPDKKINDDREYKDFVVSHFKKALLSS